MLMSVTAEEIHGDGIGMINGKNEYRIYNPTSTHHSGI